MPEELPSERSPSIEPLADRVTVPAITLFPPIVRSVKALPPAEVSVPVRLIGAVANIVARARLVAAALAEIPLTKPVLSITTPPAAVAVRMRSTPPSTTTESVILIEAWVISALILVELPDPFTVKLPAPVMTPLTLNLPAPPDLKSTVTARLLIQAAATSMTPTLVRVLPKTTKLTEGWIKFHSAWVSMANPPEPIKVMVPAAEIFSMLRVPILVTSPVSARSPATIFMLNPDPFTVPIDAVPFVVNVWFAVSTTLPKFVLEATYTSPPYFTEFAVKVRAESRNAGAPTSSPNVIMLLVLAFTVRAWALSAVTATRPPKVISAPPPPTVLLTELLNTKVTPPVPKLITSPELLMKPPTLLAALPVKFKPLLNKKVSVPATPPKVTRPLLRKSTF